jgi:hypothetical protein
MAQSLANWQGVQVDGRLLHCELVRVLVDEIFSNQRLVQRIQESGTVLMKLIVCWFRNIETVLYSLNETTCTRHRGLATRGG